MTKIIGHRGAAGLGLENSRESLLAAIKHKVDAIEFDVHRTKDGQVVVVHDKHTGRVANERQRVKELTLAELQNLELKNGQRVPTLDEIMSIVGSTPVIIEIKGSGVAELLPDILARHPKAQYSFASFEHAELIRIRELMPEARIYTLDHFKPVEIIQHAKALKANGIGLNMWLMNPLTYRIAKRAGLEFYVYTVNSPRLARFITRLYPGVGICTDYPDKMVNL